MDSILTAPTKDLEIIAAWGDVMLTGAVCGIAEQAQKIGVQFGEHRPYSGNFYEDQYIKLRYDHELGFCAIDLKQSAETKDALTTQVFEASVYKKNIEVRVFRPGAWTSHLSEVAAKAEQQMNELARRAALKESLKLSPVDDAELFTQVEEVEETPAASELKEVVVMNEFTHTNDAAHWINSMYRRGYKFLAQSYTSLEGCTWILVSMELAEVQS